MKLTEQAYALAFAAGKLAGEIERAKVVLSECIPIPTHDYSIEYSRAVSDIGKVTQERDAAFKVRDSAVKDRDEACNRLEEVKQERTNIGNRLEEVARERRELSAELSRCREILEAAMNQRDATLKRLEAVSRERDMAGRDAVRFQRKYENRRALLSDILGSYVMNSGPIGIANQSFNEFMRGILDKLRIACAEDSDSGE